MAGGGPPKPEIFTDLEENMMAFVPKAAAFGLDGPLESETIDLTGKPFYICKLFGHQPKNP